LACKHYGGEVHELGVMLLAFTPCLYCDVSDVWKLPSRRQRIAVSAAGMVVELAIAALATIVWWHTQPGLVHLVALNLMIVCSVSTLVVNGNPLLRYDGYYILSDLTDTPNLWARSREALRSGWSQFVMGLRQFDDPLINSRKKIWLAAYALASKVYLVLVVVSIVWLLVQFLRPYHLETLAYGVGLVALGGSLIPFAMTTTQLIRNPQRRSEVNSRRFASVVAALVAVTVVVLAWPVTYHVQAPTVLLPENATHVYTTVAGRLMETLPADKRVEPGVTLASFENPDLRRDVTRLEGELQLQQLRLTHLERLRGLDRTANDQIPAAQSAVADLTRQLEDRRRDAERLTITAPVAGEIIAPPRIPSQSKRQSELASWSGSLLDPENGQAWVEPGTLVCLLGDSSRLSAVVLVGDADVERVVPGQTVELCLEGLPGKIVTGEVVEVARGNPDAHQWGKPVASQLDRLFIDVVPAGHAQRLYQVTVRLDDVELPLVTGSRGQAKIATEQITLGRQILRTILRVFRAPL
jgi:putative peptide zinc metalloprotease protein